MYIGVDIGGTKTLIALLNQEGEIVKREKYPTKEKFKDFAADLVETLRQDFMSDEVKGIGIAAPGQVDYRTGDGIIFGNLSWHNVPLTKTVKAAFDLPVLVDNDANLAGLAEARRLKPPAASVVYVTISTGIGTGVIIDNRIDPHFARSEGGYMHFEQNGRLLPWEDIASGRVLKQKYGKYARELEDEAAWKEVAFNIALGLSNISALMVPEVIIIGGSIGEYLPKYHSHLTDSMQKLKEKMFELPRIIQARHPQEAVVYGCWELLKDELDG